MCWLPQTRLLRQKRKSLELSLFKMSLRSSSGALEALLFCVTSLQGSVSAQFIPMKDSTPRKAQCASLYLNSFQLQCLVLDNSKAFDYPLFPLLEGFHRFGQMHTIFTAMFRSNSRGASRFLINPPHQRLEKQNTDSC